MQQQQYYSKLQFVWSTISQGGRQELDIGVAYKVGQKYPNHNFFETSGQKDRSWDGQKTIWAEVLMTRSLDGQRT